MCKCFWDTGCPKTALAAAGLEKTFVFIFSVFRHLIDQNLPKCAWETSYYKRDSSVFSDSNPGNQVSD